MQAILNFMQSMLNFIGQHWVISEGLGAAIGFALISCLPEERPKSLDDWYRYVRESLQTAIPSRRHP